MSSNNLLKNKVAFKLFSYKLYIYIYIYIYKDNTSSKGGARGVMVIIIGNGHDDTSSNPGRD